MARRIHTHRERRALHLVNAQCHTSLGQQSGVYSSIQAKNRRDEEERRGV
ncbi:hypothetical protein E2C01_059101 [Portunus trituberculatus]|uniref:Uncharacterized protein n=1 Tax=Portunus trituberculatus TaxID=210409 RepID=A0A5B7H7F6_PORTR|nr:hypothetical protein [Portunus trituberculatus]